MSAELLFWMQLDEGLRPFSTKVKERPRLKDYVRAQFGQDLDPWQIILCNRLEEWVEKPDGRRKIHGPPRAGKSVIISGCFPAWLLGVHPEWRIGIVCYNKEHATGWTNTIRTYVRSAIHQEFFSDPACLIVEPSKEAAFSTLARKAVADSQASVIAMGIDSGYMGKGFDLIIGDDLYPSIEEAFSDAVNSRTIRFLRRDLMMRRTKGQRFLLMNHDFHNNDIGAIAVMEYNFERERYPAIADENTDGSDPTGRKMGDVLSPRAFDVEFLDEQERNDPTLYRALYQGRADEARGFVFYETDFDNRVPDPMRFAQPILALDLANGDTSKNDHCSAAYGGLLGDAKLGVNFVTEDRVASAAQPAWILFLLRDLPFNTVIAIEDTTQSKGMIAMLKTDERFRGRTVVGIKRGITSKIVFSNNWRTRTRWGDVVYFDRSIPYFEGFDMTSEHPKPAGIRYWLKHFINRCVAFDGSDGGVDDVVDSMSILDRATRGKGQDPQAKREAPKETFPLTPRQALLAEIVGD